MPLDLETVVVRLTADTSQYFASLDYAGARLLGYSAGLVAGITKHGVEMAAQFEKNSVAVKVMTRDVETGVKLLNDLTKLAVDTPFTSEELVATTKQLKAFGFETQSIIPTLQVLGNVSSGTGTDLHRIVLAFGQVKVAGKLMGTELRQFVDAGVPLINYLAKVMNKPAESIRMLVEQGRVGFDEVVQAFNAMNAEGGDFAGLMDTISKTTLSGRWQAFKETLDVTSRNFAMAALEGLGLKNVLGDITDELQKISAGDQSRTKAVFQDIRITLEGVYLFVSKTAKGIGNIVSSVTMWVKENQVIIKSVAAIVGAIWGLYLVLKVVTVTLIAIRTIMTTLYAISGIGSVIAAFSTMVVSAGALFGLLSAIAIPLAVIAGLAVALIKMDVFSAMGHGWGKFLEQMETAKTAFYGFIDAVKAGDLETAFEIAVNGIKLIFRSLFLMIKIELKSLFEGFVVGLVNSTESQWSRLSANFASTFVGLNPFKKQEDVDTQRAMVWDKYGEHQKRIGEEWAREQEKVNQQNKALADRLFKTDKQLAEYGDNIKRLSEKASQMASDKAGFDFIKDNMSALTKVQNELKWPVEKARIAYEDVGIGHPLAKTWDQMNNDLQKQNANLHQFALPLKKLMDNDTIGNNIYSMRTDSADENSIYNLLSAASKKVIDQFSAAYGIDLSKSSIRVVPNPFNANTTTGIQYAQMAEPFGVSAKAREVFNEFSKKMDKGATDWLENVQKMKAMQEAFYGSVKGNQIAVAAGGFALAGKMGSIADTTLRRFSDNEFFDNALKLAELKEPNAPNAMFGSSAAQDIINANLQNKDTTQQEVLAVLQAAKAVQDQQLIRQSKIADAMEELRKGGILKLLGIEN